MRKDIVFIRIEQLAPFPHDLIPPVIQKFPNAEVIWCQEEPKNMGAWNYVKPRIETAMREYNLVREIKYIGRKPSASPATGSYRVHNIEQKELIDKAIGI